MERFFLLRYLECTQSSLLCNQISLSASIQCSVYDSFLCDSATQSDAIMNFNR
eukprot:m.309540 g.309540  ORF g.309540 m.309540 type:complete len:53 (+) comp46802_c0_seq1:768-926(+)